LSEFFELFVGQLDNFIIVVGSFDKDIVQRFERTQAHLWMRISESQLGAGLAAAYDTLGAF
jgi:hypothetical protein